MASGSSDGDIERRNNLKVAECYALLEAISVGGDQSGETGSDETIQLCGHCCCVH